VVLQQLEVMQHQGRPWKQQRDQQQQQQQRDQQQQEQ
jgi:hypothetical protein